MPVLPSIAIKSPKWLSNGHLQTIVPNFYRTVDGISFTRERITTWDDDFLDLDWSSVNSKKLVIISHGFEGSTDRVYVKGLTRIFNENNVDVLAWNLRGCSGEDNKQLYAYHSGKTDDLDFVIQHAVKKNKYNSINLIGVSLGGNLTLKYLGEELYESVKNIEAAMAISVPIDYVSSFPKLLSFKNMIYEKRFTKQVKEKLKQKVNKHPNKIDYKHALASKNLWEFTDRYTVPVFGFKDVNDYNIKVQAKTYINNIKTPTLLLNTDNDPLLTKACYPIESAKQSKYLHLEIPINGGHVGFCEDLNAKHNWLEKRAVKFLVNGF
ncbi:MAG: alpha/beta fold hydrolase [Chitinophagales bacterium]|nr:alpha/beta fold hydrolase [Chitinophagales bacterium]